VAEAAERKRTAVTADAPAAPLRARALSAWYEQLRGGSLEKLRYKGPKLSAAAAEDFAFPAAGAQLRGVLKELDPSGRAVDERSVVFAMQCGSASYNLATSASDRDYLIVFAQAPVGSLLALEARSASTELAPSSKGYAFGDAKAAVPEGKAIEIGKYVADLCKGNPMLLEPMLCTQRPLQSSWVWTELAGLARRCVRTRRCVEQYVGFISERLHSARNALSGPANGMEASQVVRRKASKFLYHALHKLNCLRAVLDSADEESLDVPVWLADGDAARAHIMQIRGCADGLDLLDLVGRAERELSALKLRVASAELENWPAEVDFTGLSRWLVSVRLRLMAAEEASNDGQRRPSSAQPPEPLLARQTSYTTIDDLAPTSSARWTHAPQDCLLCLLLKSADDLAPTSSALDDSTYSAPASSSGAGAGAGWEERRARVCGVLEQYQADVGVTLLFAAERSSRTFGWSDAASDHDIIAVFVCPRKEYWQIGAIRKAVRKDYTLTLEDGAKTNVDIMGWEVKHACQLALGSNPTLLEALRCPATQVYIDMLPKSESPEQVSWGQRLLATATETYDLRSLAQSALNHANRDHAANIAKAGAMGKGAPRKKYLMIVRNLLVAQVFT